MPKKVEKDPGRRSDCPISCSLELIGDKWSLLIIRDMLYLKKSTYNEFLHSDEKIATNILKDRLQKLAEMGLIEFTGSDKRKRYTLTAKGRDLQPVVEAIAMFGVKHFDGTMEYAQKFLSPDQQK